MSTLSAAAMEMLDDPKQREVEINRLLLEQPINLVSLRKISKLRGGFLNNRIRARVWPKILNINRYFISDYRSFIDPHRDDSQVRCDVERSLWNLEHVGSWERIYRERRRKSLSNVIMAILCRNPQLYYYQGFHDLVSVFMLVLEDDHLAFATAEVVSRNYLADYMNVDFATVSKSMRFLLVVLKVYDPKLYDFMAHAKLEPYFATSWLITWFAHDIKSIHSVARLYDALLCSHPSFCFYVCAAYLVNLRQEILNSDCDFASLHNFLVRAPETLPLELDRIITLAEKIFNEYPPDRLRNFCGDELAALIRSNKVAIFSKPCQWLTHVDSDWTLLKNMRVNVSDTGSYPLVRYFMGAAVSWGWQTVFSGSEFIIGKEVARRDKYSGQVIKIVNPILHVVFWSAAVLTSLLLGYVILLQSAR